MSDKSSKERFTDTSPIFQYGLFYVMFTMVDFLFTSPLFVLINSANKNIDPYCFVCVFGIDRINSLSYRFSVIYWLPLCAAHRQEKETFAITALCKHASLPSFLSWY